MARAPRVLTRAARVAMMLPVAIALIASRAVEAQDPAGFAIGLTYIAVSGGAIVRLLEMPRTAKPGDEVRLLMARGTTPAELRGRIAAITPDSIAIESARDTMRLAIAGIRGAEVYRGSELKWAQGWGLGLLVGAGGFAALGAIDGSRHDCHSDDCFSAPADAFILGVGGALVGSTVGSIAGLFVRGDHWVRASRFEATRMSAAPTMIRGAPGVALRITF